MRTCLRMTRRAAERIPARFVARTDPTMSENDEEAKRPAEALSGHRPPDDTLHMGVTCP